MKKAYIIAAHRYPGHLLRLIERLNDGQSTFFVHIDKSVDIDKFDTLNKFGDKIKWVERVETAWASMGQVDAAINAMRAVVASGEPFEMVSFLSGQDYPIKSNEEIDYFFKNADKSIFLEYFQVPDYNKWANGGEWRVNKYYFGLRQHQMILSKSFNFISTIVPPLRRKMPADMKPYAGSQWFSISLDAVKYILNYVDEHPEYIAFHQKGFGPDELFFIMILVNSDSEEISGNIENDNKRFIKWAHSSSASPETLTTGDIEDISRSEALFARKFDPFVDSQVLDLIDAKILHK